MKMRKYIWIIAVLLVAAGSYWWYYKSRSSQLQQKEQYVTATAEKNNLVISVSASGNIIVDQQETVDPTITGTVADLAVEVGESVTEGQFLFNILNDELEVSVAKSAAAYEAAKNQVESADVDEDKAEADYEKAKQEDKKDSNAYTTKELKVLRNEVDLANSKEEETQINLNAAYKEYLKAQRDAAKRKVAAPISGTVIEVNVKNGDDLSRNPSSSETKAPIIIGDLSTLKASVKVNEVDISKVSIGQKAMVKLSAIENMEMPGKVEKIDSLGNEEQGVVTYDVIIALDSLDKRIKPEMSVSASIITETKENVLTIPSSAVKSQMAEDYYVEVLENGFPVQKAVQIGAANDTETEIISGLRIGDKVITQTVNSTNSSSSSSSKNSFGIPGISSGGPR